MTPTSLDTVRYLHLAPTNITFKFVLENGQWICKTSEEFLIDAERRLKMLQDDLK